MNLEHRANLSFREDTWQEMVKYSKEFSGKPSHIIRYAIYDFLNKYKNDKEFKDSIKKDIKKKVRAKDNEFKINDDTYFNDEIMSIRESYYSDGSVCCITDEGSQEFNIDNVKFDETIKECLKRDFRVKHVGSTYVEMHMPYIEDPYKYYINIANVLNPNSTRKTWLDSTVVLDDYIINRMFRNEDGDFSKTTLELLNMANKQVYKLEGSRISMELYNEIMNTK